MASLPDTFIASAVFGAVSAVLQTEGLTDLALASQGSAWRARTPGVVDGLCVIALIALIGYLHQLVRHFDLKMRGLSIFALLVTVQGLLDVTLAFRNDPLFSALSSFAIPAFATSMVIGGLFQIRQVHYPSRLATGIILTLMLAYSINPFILSFSPFDRASTPAFFSTGFSAAAIGIAGFFWWVHAKKIFELEEDKNLDPERIPIKYSAGIKDNTSHDVLKVNSLLALAEKKNLHQARLMAYVSHDLRAPLATIVGCIRLLRDIGTPEQQQHLLAIERNIAYQRELVDELLDHGRAQLGLLALRPVALNLPPLLQDISRHATELAAAQGSQTVFEIGDVLPQWVLMDGNRLTQVLLNLLSNAASATHRGVITLRVCGQNTGARWQLQFEVADTGPGIALEDQACLLEGFQPSMSATAGLGLGLHIAKHIVESMGGRLSLSSRVGKGTSFTFAVEVPHAEALPDNHRNTRSSAEVSSAVVDTSFTEQRDSNHQTMTLPPLASMDQLAIFAGSGRWSAIQDWLIAAEATHSSCDPFIARIRLLLAELDFQGIQQAANAQTGPRDDDPRQFYAGQNKANVSAFKSH